MLGGAVFGGERGDGEDSGASEKEEARAGR